MNTLVVVDDDTHLTDLIAQHLSGRGYEVHIANSVHGALQSIRQVRPDVVLLDVMLGDGAGYEVCRKIRRDPQLYRTSVLFQSALSEAREIQCAMEQGGDGYLTKPYSLSGLTGKLEIMTRLAHDINRPEPITALSGHARMRREIDHLLAREEDFALFCFFLDGLRECASALEHKEYETAANAMGRLVCRVINEGEFHHSHASYVGPMRFVALLQLEEPERFRERMKSAFEEAKHKTVELVISSQQLCGHLILHMGMIDTQSKKYTHAVEMFEVLNASLTRAQARSR